MEENNQHLSIGHKIGGHYQILKTIKQGGFGIVYQVKDTHLVKNNIFIIKELFVQSYSFRTRDNTTIGTNPKIKGIFEKIKADTIREIDILSSIENPNIVQAYGHISENKTIYSIMEYIEGIDLEEYLKENSFDEEKTIDLLEQIINGLREIHTKNIIHRDLKPSNIMRTKEGVYKIIDFTTNKTYSDKTTILTGIYTEGYSPPEFKKTKAKIGAFSDIYSLGMTLYTVLSSKNPPTVYDRSEGNVEFQNSIDGLNISERLKNVIKQMTTLKEKDRLKNLNECSHYLFPHTFNLLPSNTHEHIQDFFRSYPKSKLLSIGSILNNRYKIIKCLSINEISNTYLVEDIKQWNNFFIVKELYSKFYNDSSYPIDNNYFRTIMRTEIIKEIGCFSKINNKNIIKTYGYFEENNTIYSVMEYINFISLKNYLIEKKIMEKEAKELLSQLINGLKEIHSYNIINDNMLITSSNIIKLREHNIYKIIDFERIKSADDYYPFTCLYLNCYQSPERGYNDFYVDSQKEFRNRKINFMDESDSIYSIGMILYEAFSSEKPPTIYDRILDNYDFFNDIENLNITNSFKQIIKRMTAIKVVDRFQTFQEIEDALDTLEYKEKKI